MLTVSCSGKELSLEGEIKKYIENAKLSAENRSHSELADLISNNYRDHKNLDKKQLEKIIRAYFFTNQNIHLLTKINSITFQNENSAFIILHVAMTANIITDSNLLSSLRARVYKFELQLIKNNAWLLQQAKWQPAKIKDIF